MEKGRWTVFGVYKFLIRSDQKLVRKREVLSVEFAVDARCKIPTAQVSMRVSRGFGFLDVLQSGGFFKVAEFLLNDKIMVRSDKNFVVEFLTGWRNGVGANGLVGDSEVVCHALTREDFVRIGLEHPGMQVKLLRNLLRVFSANLRKADREIAILAL
jgi:hypothetical protein